MFAFALDQIRQAALHAKELFSYCESLLPSGSKVPEPQDLPVPSGRPFLGRGISSNNIQIRIGVLTNDKVAFGLFIPAIVLQIISIFLGPLQLTGFDSGVSVFTHFSCTLVLSFGHLLQFIQHFQMVALNMLPFTIKELVNGQRKGFKRTSL